MNYAFSYRVQNKSNDLQKLFYTRSHWVVLFTQGFNVERKSRQPGVTDWVLFTPLLLSAEEHI